MSINLEKVDYAEKYAKLTKRWLSPSELAEEFGISKSTQSKMRMRSSESNLPYSKVGKFVKYDRILINQWFEDHKVQG